MKVYFVHWSGYAFYKFIIEPLALEAISVVLQNCLKRLFKVRPFDVSTVANIVTDNEYPTIAKPTVGISDYYFSCIVWSLI